MLATNGDSCGDLDQGAAQCLDLDDIANGGAEFPVAELDRLTADA